MLTKFSEDVIPLSDLKVNAGKFISHTQDTHRPILLTSRGRGVAVMQSLEDYEKHAEDLAFMKAVAQGLLEIQEGKIQSLDEVKQYFGLI